MEGWDVCLTCTYGHGTCSRRCKINSLTCTICGGIYCLEKNFNFWLLSSVESIFVGIILGCCSAPGEPESNYTQTRNLRKSVCRTGKGEMGEVCGSRTMSVREGGRGKNNPEVTRTYYVNGPLRACRAEISSKFSFQIFPFVQLNVRTVYVCVFPVHHVTTLQRLLVF